MSNGFVDLLSDYYVREWAVRQLEPTDATPTPFPTLNGYCGDDGGGNGLAPGWFITIGGGTGQGKSLIAQNIALTAMRYGRKIGFLSLEMSHQQLAGRLNAMATGIPARDMERGRMATATGDWVVTRMAEVAGQIEGGMFLVNEEPINSMADVEAGMAILREAGCDFFVLDYLQLVSVGDDDSIYRQVTEVAGFLRLYAHREKVTVLGLSQYHTNAARDKKQPTPYDMMGGGTIANNADLVLLLDHSRYHRDEDQRHLARTWLLVAKNRHGPTGPIPILWDYRTLTCREGLDDELREWPS